MFYFLLRVPVFFVAFPGVRVGRRCRVPYGLLDPSVNVGDCDVLEKGGRKGVGKCKEVVT